MFKIRKAVGWVVYTIATLGMDIVSTKITPQQSSRLDRRLANPAGER